MKLERSGIILCTENYDACVDFYSRVTGLQVLEVLDNEHSKLTTLEFGRHSYLMIETEGDAYPRGKTIAQNPCVLRFNVKDVEVNARELESKGISVKIRREARGRVADFLDPDGNCCSLREESI